MNSHSMRVQLTLWNVGVLALVLVFLGVALRYTMQISLLNSIDRNLTDRIQTVLAHPPPPPPRADQNGPPPDGGPPPDPMRPHDPSVRILDLTGHTFGFNDQLGPFDPELFDASVQGRQEVVTRWIDHVPMRIVSAPLYDHGQTMGVVQTEASLLEMNREINRLTNALLLMAPIALLVAGLGGAFLTNRALRPVRGIQKAAEQIGAGSDLSRRLPTSGTDEFSQLAATFNAMLARLDRAFQQQRRFTGDASHELRTPLAVIKMNTSLALRGQRTPAEYREALLAADQATDRATDLIQDLLLLAHADGQQLGRNAASVCLQDVLKAAKDVLILTEAPEIRFVLPPSPLCVLGNSQQLARLFSNLLENAVRHTPASGHITITLRSDGSSQIIEIADTGEGIADEHLAHLGERFYRVGTSRARKEGGNGLGLAICKEIAEAHGGLLTIASVLGQGTTVTIKLPAIK